MARLVTRAELSRQAGVSRNSITKACSKALSEACHGQLVDLDHPSVAQYLRGKGKAPARAPTAGARKSSLPPAAPTAVPPAKDKAKPATPREVIEDGPESIEDTDGYGHLTLDEIARGFGSMTAHKEWLEMRKKQVDIAEKVIKNRELEGKLIARELVRTHVFSLIETSHSRLLSDSTKTITSRLYGLAKRDVPIEEAEAIVRDLIGSILRPAKEQAARAIRRIGRESAAAARGETAAES